MFFKWFGFCGFKFIFCIDDVYNVKGKYLEKVGIFESVDGIFLNIW